MSDPNFFVVDQLSKSFGQLKAVDDVSFSVAKNEIFGIAGPNGAGKTTLFNAISGIPFGPDSGRILFEGDAVQHLPPHKLVQQGILR
ncbi:MAG: ATP-binding cassette domain-containing protein, partial [Chloroflexota bacterium]